MQEAKNRYQILREESTTETDLIVRITDPSEDVDALAEAVIGHDQCNLRSLIIQGCFQIPPPQGYASKLDMAFAKRVNQPKNLISLVIDEYDDSIANKMVSFKRSSSTSSTCSSV